MKRLIPILILCAASVGWAATEYNRPTADANLTTSIGCSGTNIGSTSMTATYSGKSGIGPTGASSAQLVASPSSGSVYYMKSRVFTFPAGSWSGLTLYVSLSCYNDTSQTYGSCGAYYSTDSGSTWTSFGGVSLSQSTSSVLLGTVANLSTVQVGICARAKYDSTDASPTNETLTAFDIWTAGIYSSTNRQVYSYISELDEKIWSWRSARPEYRG
jgi:hypothetical protein